MRRTFLGPGGGGGCVRTLRTSMLRACCIRWRGLKILCVFERMFYTLRIRWMRESYARPYASDRCTTQDITHRFKSVSIRTIRINFVRVKIRLLIFTRNSYVSPIQNSVHDRAWCGALLKKKPSKKTWCVWEGGRKVGIGVWGYM